MVTYPATQLPTLSSFQAINAMPDSATSLRELCCELLADVPNSDRKAVLQLLDRMRRADDLQFLRGVLFAVIARFHGETAANARLLRLNERLN